MTALPLLALVWWATVSPIQVDGGSRCPTPAEIAARLPDLLLADSIAAADRDTAWVEAAGNDLVITLRGAAGEVLLRRRLVGESPAVAARCAERAAAAAVVIATWEMDRRPELSPPLPAPPAPRPPVSPARADLTTTGAAPARGESTWPRFDLALALGTSASSLGLAGTGDVELGARARQGRWGVGLVASSDSEHEQALDGGVVTWRRMAVGLAPSFRVFEGTLAVEVRAQLLAGFLAVRGQGYDQDREASDLSPGLAGGVRVMGGRGRLRPFLEAGARAWLGARNITVAAGSDVSARAPLPRIEERLTVGARVLFGD